MGTSPGDEHPRKAFGWAARDTSGLLSPFRFSRRETGATDVRFKVLFCGVCHSDIAMIKNEFAATIYPIVPGHEVVGIVTEVGYNVRRFKVGDKVGVGFISDSDRTCCNCLHDLENYCPNLIQTYSSVSYDGTVTYGGYSNNMVTDEHFVVGIPENIPLHRAAPLLCAGITTYSAMRFYGLDQPCMHLGVNGLGGLGHVAVKFAKALGLKVTVISTSPSKKVAALEHLHADAFMLSTDQDQMKAAAGTMDGVIDTVPTVRPLLPLLNLLKTSGKIVPVGLTKTPLDLPLLPMTLGRKIVGCSLVGGMKETHEMIAFAAQHNIAADVEVIPIDYLNTAVQRVLKKDVRFRFVIDVENTLLKSGC